MVKKFISVIIILSIHAPIAVAQSHSESSRLDAPIAPLKAHSLLWTNLRVVDPTLNDQTPFRQIVTQTFLARFLANCPLGAQNEGMSPEPLEVLELRKALREEGLPANLTEEELKVFESDPGDFRFRLLDDIQFVKRFHGGGNFAKRVKYNGLHFVIDFIKAYAVERMRKPSFRFKNYLGVSQVNMDQAAAVIGELDVNCESLIANSHVGPVPFEPPFFARIREANKQHRRQFDMAFDPKKTLH